MKALEENRYPFSDGKNKVEPVEGYYYAIATISQSTYRREEILSLLQVITDYFKSNQPDKLSLLNLSSQFSPLSTYFLQFKF